MLLRFELLIECELIVGWARPYHALVQTDAANEETARRALENFSSERAYSSRRSTIRVRSSVLI